MNGFLSVSPYVWTRVPGTGLEVFSYADREVIVGCDDRNLVIHHPMESTVIVRKELT